MGRRRLAERSGLRALACAALFAADQALAALCVESNAAGALLSPGGGVDLDAFALAFAFIGARLLLALAVCASLAWTAAEVVGHAVQFKR